MLAPALCRANAQKGWLGNDCRIGIEAHQPSGERAVYPAEFLVNNGFADQISGERNSEVMQSLCDKEVGGDSSLHIVGAAAIQAAAVDLSAERIMLPRQRTGRDCVNVAGENERPASATRTFSGCERSAGCGIHVLASTADEK